MVWATAALGAGRLYWSGVDFSNSTPVIAWVELDGSGSGALDLDNSGLLLPISFTIDSATNRIYMANLGSTISWVSLDGTGSGDLNATGATLNGPSGMAIDPSARRVYWSNNSGNAISWANLDGTGGGDLDTTGADVAAPQGAAIDLSARRIYWVNNISDTISWAALDGSGGGNLNTTGATASGPTGLAINPETGRIYWSNTDGSVSWANLDGSGGEDFPTSGIPEPAIGLAVDPFEEKLYAASTFSEAIYSGGLTDGNFTDTGIVGVNTTDVLPFAVALLGAPAAVSVEATGGTTPGSVLSCRGNWGDDLPGAYYFQTPQRFTYSWTRDGKPIAGATDADYTALAPGDYRCTETAINDGGSTAQTSAAARIAEPASTAVEKPRPRLTLRVAPRRAKARPGGKVVLKLTVRNRGRGIARRVQVCRRISERTHKAVKGRKCKGMGPLEPGAKKSRRLILRIKHRARGTHTAKIVVRGGSGANPVRPVKVKLKIARPRA